MICPRSYDLTSSPLAGEDPGKEARLLDTSPNGLITLTLLTGLQVYRDPREWIS